MEETFTEENEEQLADHVEETATVDNIIRSLDDIENDFKQGNMQAFGRSKENIINQITSLREHEIRIVNKRMNLIDIFPDVPIDDDSADLSEAFQQAFKQKRTEFDDLSEEVSALRGQIVNVSRAVENLRQ
ncbi:hypothetical protein WA158_008246 [Blastocystis sp. Blastoise]